MKALKGMIAAVLIAAALCVSYSIGTNEIGHAQKIIIAPTDAEEKTMLIVQRNNIDTIVIVKYLDTVGKIKSQ